MKPAMTLEVRVGHDWYQVWDRAKDPDHPLICGTSGGPKGAALMAGAGVMDLVAGFNATEELIGLDISDLMERQCQLEPDAAAAAGKDDRSDG